MNISFRKVSSPEAHKRLIDFLTEDVMRSGGSASECVDMHGMLLIITVCKVPWGVLILKQETDHMGAWAWFLQDTE